MPPFIPLIFWISIRQVMNYIKSYFSYIIIIAVLSIMTFTINYLSFSFIDDDNIHSVLGLAKYDLCIELSAYTPPGLIEREEVNIRRIAGDFDMYSINYRQLTIDDIDTTVYVYSDFEECGVLIGGKYPNDSREIALTSVMSRRLEKSLGDSVLVDFNTHRQEYLVVGLYQNVGGLGQNVALCENGMKRIDPYFESSSYYLTFRHPKDIGEIQRNLEYHLEKYRINIVNYSQTNSKATRQSIIKRVERG